MDFAGHRVVAFESRKALEMASLIERHGGVPISAPAMREVALSPNQDALDFARALQDGAIDIVVLMTGVGIKALVTEIAPMMDATAFASLLSKVHVIARGPKPALVLRDLGVTNFTAVSQPNTWREVLEAVVSVGPIERRTVAVQEVGVPNAELYSELKQAGAVVMAVPVYRWALPQDTTPLRKALHSIAEGHIKIALFTSRAQVEHTFVVASEEGIHQRVLMALRQGVVASIGPVCSEALAVEQLVADLEPQHPKMGHLVKETALQAVQILARKAGHSS